MNRNSELQAIAEELRALTARVEALLAASEEVVEVEKVVEVGEMVRPVLALPLNDRYRFQRELFGGSAAELNALIEKLVPMTSAAEVETELTARGFDLENETVKDLLRLTTRRFDAHPPLLG